MIEKGRRNDVVLGYCHGGSVANCFMDSVISTLSEDTRRPYRRLAQYYPQQGPYIHENRALIARFFLEQTDAQWLWMCDNDMDFPVDALYRLLEAAEEHDCRVLGAAYWNQYGLSERYLSWLLLDPQSGVIAIPRLPDDEDPVEVNAVGMGCTLIHRDVLQDVADMHPNDPWDTFGADMLLLFEDGGMLSARSPDDFDQEQIKTRKVKIMQRMGEDVTFCVRAIKAGYKIYGLPSLIAEHYKTHFMAHGETVLDSEEDLPLVR